MGVDFLNIEYFIVALSRGFEGSAVFVQALPDWLIGLMQTIMIVGLMSTLVILVLAVYVQIRLQQVEHEGFHLLEEKARERQEPEVATHHTNDRWDHIVALANGTSQGDWRRAILEADIMLGDVLRETGYPGATVGEQLKHSNPLQFTTIRLAWDAHMMRNKVAHEGENMVLNERDVRSTIDYYKRVFEELGAI